VESLKYGIIKISNPILPVGGIGVGKSSIMDFIANVLGKVPDDYDFPDHSDE
jgi:hypothetical protein